MKKTPWIRFDWIGFQRQEDSSCNFILDYVGNLQKVGVCEARRNLRSWHYYCQSCLCSGSADLHYRKYTSRFNFFVFKSIHFYSGDNFSHCFVVHDIPWVLLLHHICFHQRCVEWGVVLHRSIQQKVCLKWEYYTISNQGDTSNLYF